MLIKTFTDNNIKVDHACDDADKLIVETAVNNSINFTTTVLGQDVDLVCSSNSTSSRTYRHDVLQTKIWLNKIKTVFVN